MRPGTLEIRDAVLKDAKGQGIIIEETNIDNLVFSILDLADQFRHIAHENNIPLHRKQAESLAIIMQEAVLKTLLDSNSLR